MDRHYIDLQEYESKCATLTEDECIILQTKFSKYISIQSEPDGKYQLKAKHYVCEIILPHHIISVRPKIAALNFFYMLSKTYDMDPFTIEPSKFRREPRIFEVILENFLSRVERLCKNGIARGYYEVEDNLPFVRGRILLKENISRNLASQHMNFCRYSDFGPDNQENRVIKYTLFQLASMDIQRQELSQTIKLLLHYFDQVSYVSIQRGNFPKLTFTRLTKHYEPIISLCKLLLERTSLNLQNRGSINFSGFTIDMNILFERFIFTLLKSHLDPYGLIIRGGNKKQSEFSDEEEDIMIQPDVTIEKPGVAIVIVDAKYKREVLQDNKDLNQVWIYSIALGALNGALVYPRHELPDRYIDQHTLQRNGVRIRISTIELRKSTLRSFEKECYRFVNEIRSLL